MVCKQGHTFEDKLACPTCAEQASAAMLMEFLERAIRNRERTFRTLDHIVVNADYWRRVLRDQGVSLNDLAVPVVCGSLVALSEIGRQQGRIHRAMKIEQESGKCRKCEARLAALSSEAGTRSALSLD